MFDRKAGMSKNPQAAGNPPVIVLILRVQVKVKPTVLNYLASFFWCEHRLN